MIRATVMACALGLLVACAPAEQVVDADRSVEPRRSPSRTSPRPAPPRPRVARPAPRPPVRRRPPRFNEKRWTAQRGAWQKVLKDITPLARRGATLPTAKLRKHFRLRSIWHVPSFSARKLPPAKRTLLAPTGPAAKPLVNGPAGRQIRVEVTGPKAGAAKTLVQEVCRLAGGCGLRCSALAPVAPNAREAEIRRLVRLRTDHALTLSIHARAAAVKIEAAVPTKSTDALSIASRITRAVSPLGAAVKLRPRPLSRLALGLTVTGDPARLDRAAPLRIARSLCRLADRLPDRIHRAWHSTDALLRKRSQALAGWLGLKFVDRKVHSKRPRLEHRYVRKHYRDRVFNWRRRADGAYLITPLMIVLHHTGGLSLRSALYTLTSLKLGSRSGYQSPGSLAVGVPYLVARNGTIYRLFRDDHRFGRHTIALNHSALGIENVGTRRSGLTTAQIAVDVKLVQYLALRYPLRYLIGHREVYQMARTPYYLEAVPGYCSNKSDPNWATLRSVRRATRGLGLEAAPRGKPRLVSCRAMHRYFKRRRRAARKP